MEISNKNVTEDKIVEISQRIKKEGKTIAFTNGCFDLFHFGHLQTFKEAKSIADIVIVGVNSNASIRRLKGDKRPIIDELYRAELIAALEDVDYVVIFEEDSPAGLIDKIKPDYYLKGSDWKDKKLPEEEVVNKNGGKIHYVDLINDLSSTSIINKIIKVYGENEETYKHLCKVRNRF